MKNKCTNTKKIYTKFTNFTSNIPEHDPRQSYKFLNHAYMYYGGEADLYLHLNESRKQSKRPHKYKSYYFQSFADMRRQSNSSLFDYVISILSSIHPQ